MENITLEELNEEVKKLKKEFAKLQEDLEFARGTEEAWEEIDKGNSKKMNVKDFLNEIESLK